MLRQLGFHISNGSSLVLHISPMNTAPSTMVTGKWCFLPDWCPCFQSTILLFYFLFQIFLSPSHLLYVFFGGKSMFKTPYQILFSFICLYYASKKKKNHWILVYFLLIWKENWGSRLFWVGHHSGALLSLPQISVRKVSIVVKLMLEKLPNLLFSFKNLLGNLLQQIR